MVSINLHLPDDIKAKLDRRAAEQGHSVQAYIEALVREDVAYDAVGGPRRTAVESTDEFEAKLMEGLQGTGRLLTETDCEAIKRRFFERQARRGTE